MDDMDRMDWTADVDKQHGARAFDNEARTTENEP